MRKLLLIFVMIFLFNLINGISICVDHDPPTWNATFSFNSTAGKVFLDWEPASDIPNCSGIDHYEIYRSSNGINFSYIASTSETQYTDAGLADGTYQYIIHAFDRAGHNEGGGAPTGEIVVSGGSSPSSGGGGLGGGSGGGIFSDNTLYNCGAWGACENGIQERICESSGGGVSKTETRECILNFQPLSSENEISEQREQEQISTNFLTGAVTGVTNFAKTKKGFSMLIFVGLIIILGAVVLSRRKKPYLLHQ